MTDFPTSSAVSAVLANGQPMDGPPLASIINDAIAATQEALAALEGGGGEEPAAVDIEDVTGLQAALDAKAASTHTHAISDVTGLQTALDDLETAIDGVVVGPIASTDITDFGEAVDDRVGALITGGSGIAATYNDGAGTFTVESTDTPVTFTASRIIGAASDDTVYGALTAAETSAILLPTATATSSSGVLTIDCSKPVALHTMDENITAAPTFTNWPASGVLGRVFTCYTQDGTGGRTLVETGLHAAGGTVPAIASGAGDVTWRQYWTVDGGTTVYVSAMGEDFTAIA